MSAQTQFADLKDELLKRDDVRAEYDGLAEEFSLAEALLRARAEADMTQAQVAESVRRQAEWDQRGVSVSEALLHLG
jgi:hypothetical protein